MRRCEQNERTKQIPAFAVGCRSNELLQLFPLHKVERQLWCEGIERVKNRGVFVAPKLHRDQRAVRARKIGILSHTSPYKIVSDLDSVTTLRYLMVEPFFTPTLASIVRFFVS